MKTKILGLTALLLILFSSGCGSNDYILDKNEEIVKYEKTGQMLRKDILCKPDSDSEVYAIYKTYEDQLENKLEDLPTCEDFTVNSNETSSIWQFLFVKPTAWAINSVGELVGSLGVAVMLVGLCIRIILLPVQIKNSRQSQNMKKAMPEMKKIEEKYKNRTDRDSQMAKSQEMMGVYSKYKVNPATGCLLAFIQLPIFFAFLDAIYRTPAIYEETLFGWNLGTTPLVGIQNGNYSYIVLLVLIAFSTFFSFKYSMSQAPTMNEASAKQTKMMMNIMVVIILVSSINFPTALHFYWIVTYAFIALQTYLIKWYLGDRKPKKDKIIKEEKSNKIKNRLDKKEGRENGKISKRSKND